MSGEGQSFEFEQRLSETVTLRQHLLDQLHMELREPVDRLIGIHLIDKLDGSGYLTGELGITEDAKLAWYHPEIDTPLPCWLLRSL